MKYAVVEGERREAQPKLSASCPACRHAMIARCGQHRIWHWAHRGTRTCDHWWEPETEWHRAWKNQFRKDWQEVVQTSELGEKHIADVKTGHGVVLEFQHSFLSQSERESREAFYRNMVWIVDGRRRARDMVRLFESLRTSIVLSREPLIVSVPSSGSALLRDWIASRVPAYFDFGDAESGDTLWRLDPGSSNDRAYLSPASKSSFLEAQNTGQPFEEMFTEVVRHAAAGYLMQQTYRSQPLAGFERYMVRRQTARHRF